MIAKCFIFIILALTLAAAVPVNNIEEKNSVKGDINKKVDVSAKPGNNRWNELRYLSLSVVGDTQNTLSNIKTKTAVVLDNAVNKLQSIKEQGLKLIAEGQQTTAEVKAEILAAYKALGDVLTVRHPNIKIGNAQNPKLVKKNVKVADVNKVDNPVVAKNQ